MFSLVGIFTIGYVWIAECGDMAIRCEPASFLALVRVDLCDKGKLAGWRIALTFWFFLVKQKEQNKMSNCLLNRTKGR